MPDPLPTTEELQRTLEICERATEGPWAAYSYGEKCYAFAVVTAVPIDDEKDCEQIGGWMDHHPEKENLLITEDGTECISIDGICQAECQSGQDDFSFVIHARTALPAYARHLLRLMEVVREFPPRHKPLCTKWTRAMDDLNGLHEVGPIRGCTCGLSEKLKELGIKP